MVKLSEARRTSRMLEHLVKVAKLREDLTQYPPNEIQVFENIGAITEIKVDKVTVRVTTDGLNKIKQGVMDCVVHEYEYLSEHLESLGVTIDEGGEHGNG